MGTKSIYKSAAGERAIMEFYKSVITRWPVPYQTLSLPTRHGNSRLDAGWLETRP